MFLKKYCKLQCKEEKFLKYIQEIIYSASAKKEIE